MFKPLSGIVGALVLMLLVGPSWAGDGTSSKFARGNFKQAKKEHTRGGEVGEDGEALEEALADAIRGVLDEFEETRSRHERKEEPPVVVDQNGNELSVVNFGHDEETGAVQIEVEVEQGSGVRAGEGYEDDGSSRRGASGLGSK